MSKQRNAQFHILWLVVVLLVGVMIAPASQASGPLDCVIDGHDDQCEEWVATVDNEAGYNGGGFDYLSTQAISPTGDTLYVAGPSQGIDPTGAWDILVTALNTTTGDTRWTARYAGSSGHWDTVADSIVSEDGATLYLTGFQDYDVANLNGGDLLTLAYATESGELLWANSYNGPAYSYDQGWRVDLSPRCGWLYVTGESERSEGNFTLRGFVTIAYDGQTGEQIWLARHEPPGRRALAGDFKVSQDGETVIFAGNLSRASRGGREITTVAYHTGLPEKCEDPPLSNRGTLAWAALYGGIGGDSSNVATSLEISPDNSTAYVSGGTQAEGVTVQGSTRKATTIAYDLATGAEKWVSIFAGYSPHTSTGVANSVLSEDGNSLYVAGFAALDSTGADSDFFTIAYNVVDGSKLWDARYGAPEFKIELAMAIDVTASGSRVIVGGRSIPAPGGNLCIFSGQPCLSTVVGDMAVIAYDSVTGKQAWAARYNITSPFGPSYAQAYDVTVHPNGERVYVGGTLQYADRSAGLVSPTNGGDMVIAAYDTEPSS